MIILKELLRKVTEKDIMEHYWGCALYENKPIYKNPMRDDKRGTCYFKWIGDKYYLIDRGGGFDANFDCFKYVRWLYNCSFYESLYRIDSDLNIDLKPNGEPLEHTKKSKERRVAFKIQTRKYTQQDLNYWKQFSITPKTLRHFKVYCVDKAYSNAKCASRWELTYQYRNDLCFAYVFDDRAKLYRPYSELSKWRSNTRSSDIFGLNLLPKRGQTLYIASGCKDAMCLYEMGLDVVAPQSESAGIPLDLMLKLSKNFREIIIVYDNDATGIKQSQLLSEKYNCFYITLPNEYGKDVAEIVNKTSLDYTMNLITNGTKFKYTETGGVISRINATTSSYELIS